MFGSYKISPYFCKVPIRYKLEYNTRTMRFNMFKLSTALFLAITTASYAASGSEPPSGTNLLVEDEKFIILPMSEHNDSTNNNQLISKVNPFPAFLLIDTTLSTIRVSDELSIQVELHKVDFFKKSNKKDTLRKMPKENIALIPRYKFDIIRNSSDNKSPKITL